MFGKGVYFADMVSKSANYCFPSKNTPDALLLLCDVALGDMYAIYAALYCTIHKVYYFIYSFTYHLYSFTY